MDHTYLCTRNKKVCLLYPRGIFTIMHWVLYIRSDNCILVVRTTWKHSGFCIARQKQKKGKTKQIWLTWHRTPASPSAGDTTQSLLFCVCISARVCVCVRVCVRARGLFVYVSTTVSRLQFPSFGTKCRQSGLDVKSHKQRWTRGQKPIKTNEYIFSIND